MAEEVVETKSRKPADGAFLQQRLPAWQPVLTPRTVLPAFYLFGILFVPIGGLLYWNNGRIDEIMINYSHCGDYQQPIYQSPDLYSYKFSKDINITTLQAPAYHYVNASTFLDSDWKNPNNIVFKRCVVDFTIPKTMTGPVFMYYRLTNFYQNHRLYIKNYDSDQLFGHATSGSGFRTNCDPLAVAEDGNFIYPCGLIANSMFNDTFSNLTLVDTPVDKTYEFSTQNIAWPEDAQKYNPTQYSIDEIVPPPNWALRYPNGRYDQDHPPPDLKHMERFKVWMHTAALHDFRKIWGKNHHDDLTAGRWRISIDLNFDTLQYQGTKWIVLSTTTPLGGRNPYIGIAYMAIGAICFLIGLIFTLAHCIKPRQLGDERYLSWKQEDGGLPKHEKPKSLHKD